MFKEKLRCARGVASKAVRSTIDLAYLLLLVFPIVGLACIPARLLTTGQGRELLDNMIRVQPIEWAPFFAMPFLFSMFFLASRFALTAVPRLAFTRSFSERLQRYEAYVCAGAGFVATCIAFLPAYTYRSDAAFDTHFNNGFIDRPIYEIGLIVLSLVSFLLCMQAGLRGATLRKQLAANLVSRLAYVGLVFGVHLAGQIPRFRWSGAGSFFVCALVTSLILPSGIARFPRNSDASMGSRRSDSSMQGARWLPTATLRILEWLFARPWIGLGAACVVIVTFALNPSGSGLFLGSLYVFVAGLGAWALILTWLWSLALRATHRVASAVILGTMVSGCAWYADHNSQVDVVNPVRFGTGSLESSRAVSVASDFDQWAALAPAAAKDQPFVIVLAEGGGIRAAYWTSLALKSLGASPAGVLDHTYAIVGVSGGSLGAAAYMTQRLAFGRIREKEPNLLKGRHYFPGVEAMHSTAELRADFLGPWLARVMSTEVLQKLSRRRLVESKGDTLQRSWLDALSCHFAPSVGASLPWLDAVCAESRAFMNVPLVNLPREVGGTSVPRLVFVATHVETGQRVLFSSVHFTAADFPHSISMEDVAPATVRLVAAAHASARFPLISPPGEILDTKGVPRGRVVDGGYVDASGSLTASQMIDALETSHAHGLRPIIIDLNNTPDDENVVDVDRLTENRVGELETVGATVKSTNENRAYFVKEELRRKVCAIGGGVVTFKVKRTRDGEIGLGWTLSQTADTNLMIGMLQETEKFIGSYPHLKTPPEVMSSLLTQARSSCTDAGHL